MRKGQKSLILLAMGLGVASCATPGSDPLGTVSEDEETGLGGELVPGAFAIIREIQGDAEAGGSRTGGKAFVKGIRVLESEKPLSGCVEYDLGNISYTSPSCNDEK